MPTEHERSGAARDAKKHFDNIKADKNRSKKGCAFFMLAVLGSVALAEEVVRRYVA